MIYHGIGIKSSYYNDLTKNMDLICVESVDRETILKKMNFNAVNTGFPKFDLFKLKNLKQKMNTYCMHLHFFLHHYKKQFLI